MKNRYIALNIIIFTLFISTFYFGVQYIRYKGHNEYHRSRMYEYQLLANLYKVFPVKTKLNHFLKTMKLDKSIIRQSKNGTITIGIKPELLIPKKDYRDYSGFYVVFKNYRLKKIMPVGPDQAENEINIQQLGLDKHFDYYQKPD